MTYHDYIRSDQWAKLRKRAIFRDGFKCRVCPSQKALQVHHVAYPSKWDDDNLDNLITLCPKHHRYRHDIGRAVHISVPISIAMAHLSSGVNHV